MKASAAGLRPRGACRFNAAAEERLELFDRVREDPRPDCGILVNLALSSRSRGQSHDDHALRAMASTQDEDTSFTEPSQVCGMIGGVRLLMEGLVRYPGRPCRKLDDVQRLRKPSAIFGCASCVQSEEQKNRYETDGFSQCLLRTRVDWRSTAVPETLTPGAAVAIQTCDGATTS